MLLNDFYKVESQVKEEGKVITQIRINKNHEIFKGHFPGQPVVPGVCLTQIVKEILELEVGDKLMMIKGSNIKFMAVVDPDVNSSLKYEITYKDIEEGVNASCIASFEETTAFKFKGAFKVK